MSAGITFSFSVIFIPRANVLSRVLFSFWWVLAHPKCLTNISTVTSSHPMVRSTIPFNLRAAFRNTDAGTKLIYLLVDG